LLPRSKSLAPASRAPVPACRCWRRRTKRSRLRATGQRSTCARLARRRRLPLRALRRLAPVALQQHPNRWCRRRREPPGSRGLGGPGRPSGGWRALGGRVARSARARPRSIAVARRW